MDIIEEICEKGVVERRFNLTVNGELVPGIHWLPEAASTPHPTVLIGHGGTQHKRVPNVLGLARKLVRHGGYGVVALDAPGHGDRMSDEQRRERDELLARRQGERLAPLSGRRVRAMGEVAVQAVAEWKALLDDLTSDQQWADGPFGYWGVSMGTAFGIPLLVDEPRIVAAVLGLGALREESERLREQAARIVVPLLFLFQWDDELMTREGGLALWDAFGSTEKTMHINPGPHVGIPMFERDAALAFYERHL
ncbi:MAG: alpha/beta hydrolase [Acidimicrobiales bacterium]